MTAAAAGCPWLPGRHPASCAQGSLVTYQQCGFGEMPRRDCCLATRRSASEMACTSALTIISPFKKKLLSLSPFGTGGVGIIAWSSTGPAQREQPWGAPAAAGVAPGPALSPGAGLGCVLLPGPPGPACPTPAWPQSACRRQAGVQGRLCAAEQDAALLALGTHACLDQQ